jgi:hypothetical protein
MGFVVIARHRVAARRRSAIKGAGRHRSQFDAWSLPARRAPCCQRRTHPAPKSRRGPALADNAGCERITGCSSGCRATYSSLLDFTERDVSMGKVNIKTLAESDQELLDGPMIYSPIGWCPISKTRLTGSGSPPTGSQGTPSAASAARSARPSGRIPARVTQSIGQVTTGVGGIRPVRYVLPISSLAACGNVATRSFMNLRRSSE